MGVCLSVVQPNRLFVSDPPKSPAWKEKHAQWDKVQSLISQVPNKHHQTCLNVVSRFIKKHLESGQHDSTLLLHPSIESSLPEYWVHFLVLHQDYAFLALLIQNGAPLQCPSDCRHERPEDATIFYHLNPMISEERDLSSLTEEELKKEEGNKLDHANEQKRFESPESPRGSKTGVIPVDQDSQSQAQSQSLSPMKALKDEAIQKDLGLLIKTILIHSTRDFLLIPSIASNRTPLQFGLISKEWQFDDLRIIIGKLEARDAWEQFTAPAFPNANANGDAKSQNREDEEDDKNKSNSYGNCMNFCIQCRVRKEEEIIELLEFSRRGWRLNGYGKVAEEENRYLKHWLLTAEKRSKYWPKLIHYLRSVIPEEVLKEMEEEEKQAKLEVKTISIQINLANDDEKKS